MIGKLQAAEIFHQLLEHRWFLSEAWERDVSLEEAIDDYVANVLAPAPSELVRFEEPPTGELFLPGLEGPAPLPETLAAAPAHGSLRGTSFRTP